MDSTIKSAIIVGVAIVVAAYVHAHFNAYNSCARDVSAQNTKHGLELFAPVLCSKK